MELTAAVVDEKVRAYPDFQPLSAVEEDHVEMLPDVFARGDYSPRDAEWVVRWYFRRYLGAYPDAERRATESTYGENDFEAVRAVIGATIDAGDPGSKLDHLTSLAGVDVPVGSAFLQFLDPDRYIVLGEREWTVLGRTGAVDEEYPDSPTIPQYVRYLESCRSVAEDCDCTLWELYQTLWLLGTE